MTDLFEHEDNASMAGQPLSSRLRPRTLDEFYGQSHLLAENSLLRVMIERDELSSLIFWGPPGCGKSTLAWIIARTTSCRFENFSAVTSGVPEMREVVKNARERRKLHDTRTILFVDEIHRFNKAQQDVLLPHVEDGSVILIGATTENPYFEINSPLISRSRILRFEPLSDEDILSILRNALSDEGRGLGGIDVVVDDDALAHIVNVCGGDARNALNALEVAAIAAPVEQGTGSRRVTVAVAEEAMQERVMRYDKNGDSHYDTISAFIKSIRGSDPDAAIYWLARMLSAGEDPKFVARRMVIAASEDIGNADPMGLVIANAAAQAVQFVGMPEARIPLAQAVTYLACAPKSNASYLAIDRALRDVAEMKSPPVPVHLRDTSYPGAKKLGHGKGYKYPHDHPGHFVEQRYLPDSATGPYYEPTDNGHEARFKQRLERLRPSAPGAAEDVTQPTPPERDS